MPTRRPRKGSSYKAGNVRRASRSTQAPRMLRAIALGAAALLIGLVISSWLRGCTLGMPDQSPYDWSNLNTSSAYYAYSENGKVVSAVGVDVSDHQGQIDWNAVAQSGVRFALVRVGNRGTTEGGLFEDERYRENIQGAQAAGLTVGAYFFSQATTVQEAQEEARFVKERLSGLELTGPVVFDLEITPGSRVEGLTQTQATACARAFCQEAASLGTGPMIYGNSADLELYDQKLLSDYPLWFAQYQTESPACTLPFLIWQYTDSGQVPGIATPVDLNLLMKAS